MTNTTTTTPLILRVLCLHDNYSNAFDLKHEFHLLGKKLYENHSIDLVYVNGPLMVTTTDSQSTIDEKPKYIWWEERTDDSPECNDDVIEPMSQLALHCTTRKGSQHPDGIVEHLQNSTNTKATELERADPDIDMNQINRFSGLDASLMLLRQIWTSCPFWGIMGVGKGAAVASLFITILESESLTYHAAATTNTDHANALSHVPTPPILPQLIMFVSGESLLSVDEPLLVSDYYNNLELSSSSSSSPLILHLVDFDISPEEELLIRQFSQCSHIEKRRKNDDVSKSTKFTQHDLNIIGRFICERKKSLYSSDKNDTQPLLNIRNQHSKILALQTALHIAEQDAANCIAETIAMNPPSALMAVIRPQMVAGWKGNRRPQPEGGGAPCPEEFLHRKSKNVSVPQVE